MNGPIPQITFLLFTKDLIVLFSLTKCDLISGSKTMLILEPNKYKKKLCGQRYCDFLVDLPHERRRLLKPYLLNAKHMFINLSCNKKKIKMNGFITLGDLTLFFRDSICHCPRTSHNHTREERLVLPNPLYLRLCTNYGQERSYTKSNNSIENIAILILVEKLNCNFIDSKRSDDNVLILR
ncbi:hypothetical protein AGLY_001800 [Aphis glycines]|uniref:Uncharacterized protein n=1 Tax=Aphis glycines TaxID=307491 RepID=A0A6G0U4R1_APHGL|nr:hypothetical protein AGLY_001800 [Aphis glycines]